MTSNYWDNAHETLCAKYNVTQDQLDVVGDYMADTDMSHWIGAEVATKAAVTASVADDIIWALAEYEDKQPRHFDTTNPGWREDFHADDGI